MRRLAIAVSLLLVLGGWDWLTSADPEVKAGNEAFEQGSYAEALGLYERSKESAGTRAAIRFDIGAALYKMAAKESDADKRAQLLDRAESAFREATDTDDVQLKSAAFHNLGNSMFVRERWKPAAESYKKALKANQENDDARYNLELVLRRQQKKKQKQQGQGQGQGNSQPKNPGQGQQQKPQGSDGGNQNGNDPSGDNQAPKPQGPGQQAQDPQAGSGSDQANQPKPGDGNQKGNPTQGQPNQPQPQPGQGAPQNQPQPGKGQQAPKGAGGGQPSPDGADARGELSPGEGETKTDRDRKLDALENRSRDLRKRRLRRGGASGRSGRFNNAKDW